MIKNIELINFYNEMYNVKNIIKHAHRTDKDIDIFSKLYHELSEIKYSPILGMFYFLTTMSYWNLKNNVKYIFEKTKIPQLKEGISHSPIYWGLCLSESATYKSIQMDLINDIIPVNCRPNMHNNKSNLAFLQELKEKKYCYWAQDEAAEFIRRMDNAYDPLSEIKDSLLKAKSQSQITYRSNKSGEISINPSLIIFFASTIHKTKESLKYDSLLDGLASRFSFMLLDKTSSFDKNNIIINDDIEVKNNYINLSKILGKNIKEDVAKMFNQDISDKKYLISKEVEIEYDKMFNNIRKSFNIKSYGNDIFKPFINRAIFDATSLAVFHHQMNFKESEYLDLDDFEFAAQITEFCLLSAIKFLSLKGVSLESANSKTYMQKQRILQYIKFNPNCKKRDIYRKFNIKKAELEDILK